MSEPEIRFKGFEGKWESLSLKEVCEINPQSSLPETFEYVDLESVVGTSMLSHRTENRSSAPSRAQRLAKNNDIFYQTVRPYQKNNYLFINQNANFVFSTGYAQLRTKINSKYLFNILQTESFVGQVLLNCTGTSYPAINPNSLSNLTIRITENFSEQEQIATYFCTLDILIQSMIKKITTLKQLKSASLLSMFPQTGETKPRIRFEGFEGDWEKKNLNMCLSISTEKNISDNYGIEDVLSVSDDFGVMNQIELLGRSYAGKSVRNYGILKKGEIVYTKSPLKSKPFGIIKQNTYRTGIVSVLYAVYTAKDGISADYIHYYFDPAWRLNAYMRPLVNKGAKNTMNISNETALDGFIMIPQNIAEQQQIASFFHSLDTQISLEAQRLEKLKQIKSACLDKMFV